MKQFPFKDFILITGLPRTGTTLTGKIIGSCRGVEYFFEPPLIPTLFYEMHAMADQQVMNLFEAYCTHELMYQSLSGRRINFNVNDDSYIGNQKSVSQIKSRLKKSYRTSELAGLAGNHIFCMKVPGIASSLNRLKQLYPDIKIIVVDRAFNAISRSIQSKGWFNNENPNRIYPSEKVGRDYVPSVIPKKWRKEWSNLNELEKITIYIISQKEQLAKARVDYELNYEFFVNNPNSFYKLFTHLHIEVGEKTSSLIESIQPKSYAHFKMGNSLRSEIKKRAQLFGLDE